jgi:hypothetical protein
MSAAKRVQNDTMGRRGRKDDPLYRCRRLFTKADERLDDKARTKLLGLLDATLAAKSAPRGTRRKSCAASTTIMTPTSPTSSSIGSVATSKTLSPDRGAFARPDPHPLEGSDRRVAART